MSQSQPPTKVLLVDSGSTDGTLEIASRYGVTVIPYPKEEKFHYSRSLNLGLQFLTDPWVFILSSHTLLEASTIAEDMVGTLASDPHVIGGYAVAGDSPAPSTNPPSITKVNQKHFDGYNGLWNTCSVIRRSKWLERPFSIEPWTAEDQEWAGWFFNRDEEAATLRFEGLPVRNRNPRVSLWKHCSEFVSIATFSRRDLYPTLHVVRSLLSVLRRSLRCGSLVNNPHFLKPLCLVLYRLRLLRFDSNYHSGPPFWLRHWFITPSNP